MRHAITLWQSNIKICRNLSYNCLRIVAVLRQNSLTKWLTNADFGLYHDLLADQLIIFKIGQSARWLCHSLTITFFSRPASPHLCHYGDLDKRCAYWVGIEDAWPQEHSHDADLRKGDQRQGCRGYEPPGTAHRWRLCPGIERHTQANHQWADPS